MSVSSDNRLGSAGQTQDEATAGIFPANTAYSENDVRRYGLSVGTGSDDTAAINALLAVAAVNRRPARFAGQTLISSGGHVRDASKFGVELEGASINFSSLAENGFAWNDTCTVGGANHDSQHARYPMRDGFFFGADVSGTRGLLISATAEPAAAFLGYYNLTIEHFFSNLEFGDNAYILNFYNFHSNEATNGINIPQTITDAAEGIHFHGGSITNCGTGLNNQNGNTDVTLHGMSIDGCTTYIATGHGSRTFYYGPHIEFLNAASLSTSPILVHGTNSVLVLNGGSVTADGTPPFSYPSVFDIDAGAQLILSGGILLNNLQNTANALCSGAGSCVVLGPTGTYQYTLNPRLLGTVGNFNSLVDGGFEQSTIQDNISIANDVSSAVTISNASPAVVSWSPHRQAVGQPIVFSTTGALPAGINAGQTYYVIAAGLVSGSFEFSDTLSGPAINTTSAGSGTQTCTAVVTNRVTGSHIQLANTAAQAHSGTQSLAATLNGGLGAVYRVVVPVKAGQRISASGWCMATTAQAVQAFIFGGFASDVAYGLGGVPIFLGPSLQSGATIGSPLPTTWTQFFLPEFVVPSWCKYFFINFNLNALFSNTFYLDDLVVSVK